MGVGKERQTVANGRSGDGEGLPEVGFGSRDAQSYTPRASCHLKCLLGSLGEMEGIRFRPLDKTKGSGKLVFRLLSDTGGDLVHCHQRRARCLQEWFSNAHDLCADFRGVGDCRVS